MSTHKDANYVLGHDQRELRRLALQAAILDPVTEQLLRRGGLTAGMSVIDYGCGVGDVSMLAARLVGSGGRVTSVDLDENTLSLARQRAQAKGFNNITFIQADVTRFLPASPADATIGRHILIHLPTPLTLLQCAHQALKPGGVAIFQEYDFSLQTQAFPSAPVRDQVFNVFREFFARATRDNMGGQLYHLAVRAGFSRLECRAEFPIGGGDDSPYFEWIAESARTIVPRALALGAPSARGVALDDLEARLREESVAAQSSFPAPAMVGCIARKGS